MDEQQHRHLRVAEDHAGAGRTAVADVLRDAAEMLDSYIKQRLGECSETDPLWQVAVSLADQHRVLADRERTA